MNNFIYDYYAVIEMMVIASHAAILSFIVIGLALLLLNSRNFRENRLLRLAHLFASVYVVVTTLIGMMFPVKELEAYFSREAGGAPYPNLISVQWLQDFLGNPAPEWAFLLIFIFLTGLIWAQYKLRPPQSEQEKS